MIEVKLCDMRRFLPLPYEAALAPRLVRAQSWVEGASASWLAEDPGALEAASAELVRGTRVLAAAGDGGPGAWGVHRFLAGGSGPEVVFPEASSAGLESLLARGEPFSVFASGPCEDPGALALVECLAEALAARLGPEEARRHVLAAAVEGTPLMDLARASGWRVLPVPEEAGRWDVLTAAGLVPAAASGGEVRALLRGASAMLSRCREASYENPAWRYGAVRYELCRRGWTVEVLSSRDRALGGVLAWWRELFAGCEGHDGKGLFPAVLDAGASDRGLGQYLQDGRRLMFETALRVGRASPGETEAGRRLDLLRDRAQEAGLRSRCQAGVPSILLEASPGGAFQSPAAARAEALGALLCFLQFASGLSARLLDVDPQEWSGAPAYGQSMASLLFAPAGTPSPGLACHGQL